MISTLFSQMMHSQEVPLYVSAQEYPTTSPRSSSFQGFSSNLVIHGCSVLRMALHFNLNKSVFSLVKAGADITPLEMPEVLDAFQN